MNPSRRRWLLGGLLAATTLIAGAGYWLFGQLDAIIKRAVQHYGGQMTQAKVSVDSVQLRSSDGIGLVRGLTVGNPRGFRTPYALKVSVIEVEVDVRTLADPVVHVKRIVIEAPDLHYEMGEASTNFEAIQQNIARALAGDAPTRGADSAAPKRRLIVDELIIRNARAHATAPALLGQSVSATLPNIRMRQLGRAKGGLTPAQLGDVVARAISQRLVASLAFERVLQSLGDRVKGLIGR